MGWKYVAATACACLLLSPVDTRTEPEFVVTRRREPSAHTPQAQSLVDTSMSPVSPETPHPLDGIEEEAEAIRWCESRDNYHGQNPASSASGAYQFIDSTWAWVTGLEPPASDYSPEIQDRAFAKLWDRGQGASHWAPSRFCWEPIIGPR